MLGTNAHAVSTRLTVAGIVPVSIYLPRLFVGELNGGIHFVLLFTGFEQHRGLLGRIFIGHSEVGRDIA